MRYLVFSVLGIITVLGAVALAGRSAEGNIDPTGEYHVQMNVLNDPAGHAPSIGMPANITLSVSIVENEPRVSGPAPFVGVHGTLYKDPFVGLSWEINMTGIGTVAGRPDVWVSLTGTIDGGVLTGIYTMDTYGELPGGQAIEYRVKPKEATATPTTCPQGSGVAGSQQCPATPAATATAITTPGGLDSNVDFGCELTIQVSDNQGITGSEDGVDIDCDLQYRSNDAQTGQQNAQTVFDSNQSGVFVSPNGNITGADDGVTIELDSCDGTGNLSVPGVGSFWMRCRVIIRALGILGGGFSAGGSTKVLESEGLELTTTAAFPPFGAQWESGAVRIPIVNTTTDAVAGYITALGLELSPFGDVNCNMSADSVDAAIVLQLTAALVTTLNCQDAGDVNRNGDVNAIDASLILQYVAGFLDELPV